RAWHACRALCCCSVSSRRRHTRLVSDWSSDVCSSDLKAHGIGRGDVVTIQLPNWIEFAFVFFALELIGAVANKISPDFRSREVRSEERRVGKEWRSRGGPCQCKKN